MPQHPKGILISPQTEECAKKAGFFVIFQSFSHYYIKTIG